MRILLIHYKIDVKGGPEVYLKSLSHELELRGHSVGIFSYNWKEESFNSKWPGNGDINFSISRTTLMDKVKRVPSMIYDQDVIACLEKFILTFKPDKAIVMLFLGKLPSKLFSVLLKNSIPYYIRISDFSSVCATSILYQPDKGLCLKCIESGQIKGLVNNCNNNYMISTLHYFLRQKLILSDYNKAEAFIVPSINTKSILSNSKLYSKARFEVIPTYSPLELQDFTNKSISRKIIAYWGRVSPEKNVLSLARWMVKMSKIHHNWKFRIIGLDNSSYSEQIRAVFGSSSNCETYKFDSLESLKNKFQETTYYISDSLIYDNFPQSPLVALSLGVKVLLPNIGSYREVVRNDNMGFIYNSYDDLDSIFTWQNYNRMDVYRNYKKYFGKEQHFEKLMKLF